jgi:hypothetical protein
MAPGSGRQVHVTLFLKGLDDGSTLVLGGLRRDFDVHGL